MVIFNTFNFRQISKYQFKGTKTADHILEISKQGAFNASQLLGGNVMFTRFKRQYLISVYSRAHDLPKVFSDLDPELHFKDF